MQYGLQSGKTLTCEKCSKSFPRKETLTRHVKSLHEKRKYSCAICGERFSLSKIKTHYQRCKERKNASEKAELKPYIRKCCYPSSYKTKFFKFIRRFCKHRQ